MFLGVPYHAARVYGEGRDNLVLSPDRSTALHYFAEFSTSFRMEAFFVIAGFFSALLLARQDVAQWAQSRAIRIAVPAVVCTASFGPVRAAAQILGAPDPPADVLSFWREWSGNYAAQPYMITHLWFLYALLILVAAMGGASLLARRLNWVTAALEWGEAKIVLIARRSVWLLALGFIPLAWLSMRLAPAPAPFWPMYFIHQASSYAAFFFLGGAAARSVQLRDELTTARPAILAAAVASAAIATYAAAHMHEVMYDLARAAAGFFATVAILGYGNRYLTYESPTIRYLCNASLSVYLFHLPIIFLLGITLFAWAAPPLLEWAVLTVAALGLSLVIHEAIRRSRMASLLFNGIAPGKYKPLPKTRHSPHSP